jgi:hypothetical protein
MLFCREKGTPVGTTAAPREKNATRRIKRMVVRVYSTVLGNPKWKCLLKGGPETAETFDIARMDNRRPPQAVEANHQNINTEKRYTKFSTRKIFPSLFELHEIHNPVLPKDGIQLIDKSAG